MNEYHKTLHVSSRKPRLTPQQQQVCTIRGDSQKHLRSRHYKCTTPGCSATFTASRKKQHFQASHTNPLQKPSRTKRQQITCLNSECKAWFNTNRAQTRYMAKCGTVANPKHYPTLQSIAKILAITKAQLSELRGAIKEYIQDKAFDLKSPFEGFSQSENHHDILCSYPSKI